MIGSYGSGSSRPHTEDELAKARQALSLLKEHKARGETAAQRIGTYIMGGNSDLGKYKKATATAYEPKAKFGEKQGNSNYRKVFNPTDEQEEPHEEEGKRLPGAMSHVASGKLDKVNKKYNAAPSAVETKTMSNLANLGKKALSPVNEIVANEFGMRPQMKNQVKKTESTSASKPPIRSKPPVQRQPAPPSRSEDPEDDRPIKPVKSGAPMPDEDGEEDRPIKPAAGSAAMPDEEYGDAGPVGECKYCHRKFNPESLAKHQGVCQKRPDKKKRKAFDSKKLRIVTEEQKKLAQSASKKAEPKKAAKKMPKWKMQSAQFRNALKSTTGESGGAGGAVDSAPEIDEKEGYTQCPTCGRSFNEEVAKRHMPFCANKAKMDAMKNGGKNKGAAPAKGGRKK